jgi:hypothetical protein
MELIQFGGVLLILTHTRLGGLQGQEFLLSHTHRDIIRVPVSTRTLQIVEDLLALACKVHIEFMLLVEFDTFAQALCALECLNWSMPLLALCPVSQPFRNIQRFARYNQTDPDIP